MLAVVSIKHGIYDTPEAQQVSGVRLKHCWMCTGAFLCLRLLGLSRTKKEKRKHNRHLRRCPRGADDGRGAEQVPRSGQPPKAHFCPSSASRESIASSSSSSFFGPRTFLLSSLHKRSSFPLCLFLSQKEDQVALDPRQRQKALNAHGWSESASSIIDTDMVFLMDLDQILPCFRLHVFALGEAKRTLTQIYKDILMRWPAAGQESVGSIWEEVGLLQCSAT